MPPGRNRLFRLTPPCTSASGAVALQKVGPPLIGPRPVVKPAQPCAAEPTGLVLPALGICATGGMPPDELTQTEPIQRGGMSGTVRRSRIATPKAGAVRITWTGPPGTPRVGASVNTIGCGEFVMFIAETTVFHSVDGFQFLNAMPMTLLLPGTAKLCASCSAGMPAEIANDW